MVAVAATAVVREFYSVDGSGGSSTSISGKLVVIVLAVAVAVAGIIVTVAWWLKWR